MKTIEQRLLPLKNGDISIYSLGCGYVQRRETKHRWKEIYCEHHVFHVRSGNIYPKGKTYNESTHGCFDIWESFQIDELTKARKFYHSIK